jgi:hypothetical protein
VVFAAACGVAFYNAYHLTRFHLSAIWPLQPRDDAAIIFDVPQHIVAQSAYAAGTIFPYSPSAVLIFRGLGLGGPALFMGVWYVLMIAGLIFTLRASLWQERRNIQAAWLLIGLIGILLADSPISWDLRGANSNLIYLGLVMAAYASLGAWPVLAGALIGLSVSLKLYSALLLIWLVVNGPWRAVAAAVATILVLWIVLPVLLFGVAGPLQVYAGWEHQLQILRDPLIHARPSTELPLVSLEHAVMHLTGAAYGSAAMLLRVSALWAVWLAALMWYCWRCRPFFAPMAVPSRAALADWVVLLLAPLLLSPWLEPNHCVPLLVGALLAVVIALDETMMRRDRVAALIATAALALFTVGKVPFAVRGLGLEAIFLVLVIAFAFVRPRLETAAKRPIATATGARGLAGATAISP